MGRKKKIRQEELETFTNISVCNTEHKGNPCIELPPDKEIIIELACGRGDYTIALAKMYPEKTIIGIDRKADRLWHGAQTGTAEKIPNAFFFKTHIEDLEKIIAPNTISEIWITFPDPHPPRTKAKKRLTSPLFLKRYQKILKKNALTHLKTDHEGLYNYTLKVLADEKLKALTKIEDVHAQNHIDPILQIKTDFEKRHIKAGRKIFYLNFQLTPSHFE